MRIADKGFFPWLAWALPKFFPWVFWALFKWNGRIKRLPFLCAMACFVVMLVVYKLLVGTVYAHFIIPPPDGAAPDGLYIVELLRSKIPGVIHSLPVVLLILPHAKRLRSIGASPWIAVPLVLIGLLPPQGEIIESGKQLIVMVYGAILVLMPPRSETTRDLLRRLSGGKGPIRMRGRELTNWRVIGPAFRKAADQEPAREQAGD